MSINKIFWVCVSFSAFNHLSAQAADLIPLEDFIKPDQFAHPRLSPDGKHIAISVNLPQGDRFVPTMSVFQLPEFKMISAIRMPAFEVPEDFEWLTNTRLVVSKATEHGSQEKPMSTGEVLAVNIDGSKQEYLYGYNMFKMSSKGARYDDDYGYGSVANIPSIRNGNLLLQEHKWSNKHSTLIEINSINASRKTIADLPMPGLYFTIQNNGSPRFASGTDENNYGVLFERNSEKNEWIQIKDGNLGWGFRPIAFIKDDTEVFATYTENGEPSKLVLQSMQNKTRTTIAESKEGTIDMLQWDAKGLRPFASSTNVGIPKVSYIDATLPEAQLHQNLSTQFPDSYVQFINFSDDGNKLLFSVSSDRDPGSYYLLDRQTNKAQLLFSSMEQLNPEQMAPRQAISFKSRDGMIIRGYITMHPSKDHKKLPLILMPHGGPHGIADHWFYDNDAQFLASRGYAVLQVNYRGSGGRGINFKTAGYRHWGDLIQNDLIDGVQWTIAQGYADPKRVCSYGASFGAYAALMVTIREPSMFKCAVGYAGVYDLPLIFKEENVVRNKKAYNTVVDFLGTDEEELKRNSPSYLAEKISTPVLLVHGEEDTIAPLVQAKSMRAALVKANKPYEWMLVPNEGHGFYATKNLRSFYQTLEKFLETNLAQ